MSGSKKQGFTHSINCSRGPGTVNYRDAFDRHLQFRGVFATVFFELSLSLKLTVPKLDV